jgi:CarboxypepD_reg-like domain
MNKILILLVAVFFNAQAQSQSFISSGKVIDKESGQALTGASVFCQNTTLGTTTNAQGEFSLSLAAGGYDLVVSYSGYETYSLRINNSTENIRSLLIELKQKDKSMEEVSITVTNEVKDGWEKYGGFFREQFLGMTINSSQCTIENPETLRFFFSKKKNRIKVTAKEDLRISNKALGYTIRYQLDSFVHEYGSGLTQYTGFPFFEEMTGNEEEHNRWNSNREKAYYGSVLHFMRCYYDSTLGENGYKLEKIDGGTNKSRLINNPYDSVFFNVTETRDVDLMYSGKLRVIYLNEQPERNYLLTNKLSTNTSIQISLLEFSEYITIEENGYFYDQKDLMAFGYWNWEKIADFLPYNYEPIEESHQ